VCVVSPSYARWLVPDPLIEFAQGEYDYLRAREGREFYLALAPYLNALRGRPPIDEFISTIEAEARETLKGFVAEQDEMIDEAKVIRVELAARAPEIDNSDVEEPDARSHARTHYERNSFANFDRLVDADYQIGFPSIPRDSDDPGPMSGLLIILRGRLRAAEYGEHAGGDADRIRDDLDDLGRRVGNLGERHRASAQRFRQESRTLPGMAYARLLYFGSDLVTEPVRIETDSDMGQFLDRTLREWGQPKTAVRKLSNGESLNDWELRLSAEIEATLKGEALRLHRELVRRLDMRTTVARTLTVDPLPLAHSETLTLARVARDQLTFTEFLDLMLARVVDADREQPGAYVDLVGLANDLRQDVPQQWVFDVCEALQARGLVDSLRAFGGTASARLTGEGRLYVEQGGSTGIISEYRRDPTYFVIVSGSGHQVAVGTGGSVTQTSTADGIPTEVWDLLGRIEDGIRAMGDLTAEERNRALADVQTARQQLDRPEPNKRAAAALLDPLAKIAAIAAFVTKVGELLA
jgi:hypothetical protein